MGEPYDPGSTFAALSDPTRRAILRQLMAGPARVTELAAPHDISLNSVSKHLKILEKSRLISRNIRGREHWIRGNRQALQKVRDWTTTMLEFWDTRLDCLGAVLRAENEKENRDGK